jgi:competence protein ComEA
MDRLPLTLLLVALTLTPQELPDGAGRDQTVKMCKQCHELARSISLRQDRAGWSGTMAKMVAFGMRATPEDRDLVLEYLIKHYPAEEVPKLNINEATAIEIESALSLRRSQAAALIAFREKNGAFKTIDDLKKVPNVDVEKIDAKRDRIVF